MAAKIFHLGDRDVPYYVRSMCRGDVAAVTEVDREAFPTIWPPINYRHELQNRLARYLVVCDEGRRVEMVPTGAKPGKGLSAVLSWGRQLFSRLSGNGVPPCGGPYIVGFTGLWMMADEAHIINIAVREAYRRLGIGELLLVSAIDLAIELKARIVTLEVRKSNTAAQALYRKYGMTEVGLRRGYYVDNKEDAILMSTEDIGATSFREKFQQLKQDHYRRLGVAQR